MIAGRISVCLGLLVVCCAQGSAEPPDGAAGEDRVMRLISDLGSEEYAVREAASDELARIGLPAFAALESASSHPDREVRYRSQRILGQIRQHDIQRRLDAFLSGKDDANEYPLPGWSRYRKTYGDDMPSRTLFVSLQRAEPDLMKALEDGPRPAGEFVLRRAAQHHQVLSNNQQLTLGQIVATLFVAAEEDVPLSPQTLTTLLSHCLQPTFRDAAMSSGKREIPRKMLAAVIKRSDDIAAYQAMQLANQFHMPEGLIAAERIINKQGPTRSLPMFPYALMTVARLGDASHLPLVEKLFVDKSPLTRMQENTAVYEVQLRDAALAAAVLLTKQDPKSYFNIPANQPLGDPHMIFFNARLIGFASEEKRAAVFAKWKKYENAQAGQ